MKAVQRLFMTFVRYSRARRIFVRRLSGLKSISSRIMYRMCLRPFLGGINFSILSEKNNSDLIVILNSRKCESSCNFCYHILLQLFYGAKFQTTGNIHHQHHRQFTLFLKHLHKGLLKRAVTFQSMSRISSPN